MAESDDMKKLQLTMAEMHLIRLTLLDALLAAERDGEDQKRIAIERILKKWMTLK
jgi:hypothetical protein